LIAVSPLFDVSMTPAGMPVLLFHDTALPATAVHLLRDMPETARLLSTEAT
jgi:hypothetical protein